MAKRLGENHGIRYSQAFKMALVREIEEQDVPFEHVRRKYGIRGSSTVCKWVRKFGNGSRGVRIRVEKPEEINQYEQLKRRVRALEQALADANIDLALERQYTHLACERAGIKDVAEFKKKVDGPPPTGPSSRKAPGPG
jgi:transposase-like protein